METSEIKKLFDESLTKLSPEDEADQLRIFWLGRKGELTKALHGLKEWEPSSRASRGKELNELKNYIEQNLQAKKEQAEKIRLEKNLAREALDPSLPGTNWSLMGSLHPITQIERALMDEMKRWGFSWVGGPEIETPFYNFNALNIGDHHPARDSHDTFFLLREGFLLRSHTSNQQIHQMLYQPPPLRIISTGRVFRVDQDASHAPSFHQWETLWVDKDVTFAHLKGLLKTLFQRVFSAPRLRFRPSYFPFVEPGAEVDMSCTLCSGKGCRTCKHTGWVELGGCGMVHPQVFETVGYDSESVQGCAFGMGLERMAMMMFQIPEIHLLSGADSQILGRVPLGWAGNPWGGQTL